MNKSIEELIAEFYSTFEGNKFEASAKKLKQNGDKVEAYFIEDWLREKFQSQADSFINEIEDDMELVAKEIDRLRERDEEGDDHRRRAHTHDYAMLKHTRNTIAQKLIRGELDI
jgi:hypothetical protein